MKTYTARARRNDVWWAIDVREIRGVHSQARRLDQVEDMARDAIALFLDVPVDSVDVVLEVAVPPMAEAAVVKMQDATRAVRDAEQTASDARRDAAVSLVKGEGLTLRDAGVILGLSFQRVQQLVSKSQSAGRRPAAIHTTAHGRRRKVAGRKPGRRKT